MLESAERISLFTRDDVATWYRPGTRRIFLSDVVDPTNSDSMSVGFARWAPGESNEWVVSYDEALVVTKGALTVTTEDGFETTARASEVIFLRKGTSLVYSAKDEGAEVVYVTYPHWLKAQQASEHAPLLEAYKPSDEAPAPLDSVALLRRIWGPLERGESHDLQPFFDTLADDVVFTTSAGEARGRQAVIAYFANAATTMEFNPYLKPVEYYGDGNRVIQLGDEVFTSKKTGETHRAEWAWVYELRDGLITRIVVIQDLSGVAAEIVDALAKAQAASDQAVPSA